MTVQQPSPQSWMGVPPSGPQQSVPLQSPVPASSGTLRRSVTRKAVGQGASGLQTPRPTPASMAVAQPLPQQQQQQQQHQYHHSPPQQQQQYQPFLQQHQPLHHHNHQQQQQQQQQSLPQQWPQQQQQRSDTRKSLPGPTPAHPHPPLTPSPTSQARASIGSVSSSSAGRASTAFSTPSTTITTPVSSPLTSPGGWPSASQPPPPQPRQPHQQRQQQQQQQQQQLHRSQTAPAGPAQASPAATVHHAQGAQSSSKVCNHCKAFIPVNVSVYSCVVCSTAQITTSFCIWCYTSGVADSSHPHDKAYYVTESDLRVQPPTAVPHDVWTARRNVTGTVWYTHNATGIRTHIQPKPAAFPATSQRGGQQSVAPGWHERRSVDGRSFWFNSNTGASSWTKPVVVIPELPAGWKEMRTPDLVPFYVHEAFNLSTWDRPGDQPRQRQALLGAASPAAVPARKAAMAATLGMGGFRAPSAKNVAVVGGSAGLLTATGKMFGKLAKPKNLKMVSKFASMADGEFDFGGEEDGGGGEEEVEVEEEQTATETEVACEEPCPPEEDYVGTYPTQQNPAEYTGDQAITSQEQLVQPAYPQQSQVYEQTPFTPSEQPVLEGYPPQPQMYEQPTFTSEEQPLQQTYPLQQQSAPEQSFVGAPEQPVQQAYLPQPQEYEQPPVIPQEQIVQPGYPPQSQVYEQPIQEVYPSQSLAPEQPPVISQEQLSPQGYSQQPQACEQPIDTYQQPFVLDSMTPAQQDPFQSSGYPETNVTEPVAPVGPPPTTYEETTVAQGFLPPPPPPAEPIQPLDGQTPEDVLPSAQDAAPRVSSQPAPPEQVVEEPCYDLTTMSGFPGGGLGDMTSAADGQDTTAEQQPPFVFEPILPAEPLVSPPAEQGSGVYDPTYLQHTAGQSTSGRGTSGQ